MSRTKIGIGMKRHRIYGYSKIIKHPQGWEYRVAYLSPQKTLSYSKLLWATITPTGTGITVLNFTLTLHNSDTSFNQTIGTTTNLNYNRHNRKHSKCTNSRQW